MKAKSSFNTPLLLVQSDWSGPVATDAICDYRSAERREDGKYVEHDTIPHLCHIEMTYACNEKCIFCYNPERAKLGDLSVIDRIIQSVTVRFRISEEVKPAKFHSLIEKICAPVHL